MISLKSVSLVWLVVLVAWNQHAVLLFVVAPPGAGRSLGSSLSGVSRAWLCGWCLFFL